VVSPDDGNGGLKDELVDDPVHAGAAVADVASDNEFLHRQIPDET
jgi:hypothetical protein